MINQLNCCKKSIDNNWKLTYIDYGQGERQGLYQNNCLWDKWIDAVVPGDIHIDLINAKLIEDPLTSNHAEKFLWTEEKEWWYRTSFDADYFFDGKKTELIFQGLDLNVKIWLNGYEIANHCNSFLPCVVDVTDYIRKRGNFLVVKLDCGLQSAQSRDYMKYDYGVELSYEIDMRRVFLRKPQFSFRWDWSQRLVTCGIWRPVELIVHNSAAIRDVRVYDVFNENKSVDIGFDIGVEFFSDSTDVYQLEMSISHNDSQITKTTEISSNAAIQCFNKKIHISDPALWWPVGYGDQNLYEVSVKLLQNGKQVSNYELKHGIRNIKIVEEEIEEEGRSFTVAVNGERIFCKGANWVPVDSIPARVSGEKYKNLLLKAREANFNILRVWGGGIYEDRIFYELCDELGIMVWQDFMFACAFYPDDESDFLKNTEIEIQETIKSLRNHASIVLWCGNNEIHWNYYYLKDKFPEFFGSSLYDRIIPDLCSKLDGTRPYRKSSPFGGEDANGDMEGDTHDWGFWLPGNEEKQLEYKLFSENKSKFCSEYGVMAPPCFRSMEEYIPADELYKGSETWNIHNNCYELGLIDKLLEMYYCNTEGLSLQKYIDYAQMMQADIYKYTIEHFRRRKFKCSGVMFWMYSDCWGTIGWTIVDYYTRPKASYYYVKRAYNPVLVSIKREVEEVSIWIVNDKLQSMRGILEYGLRKFTGEIIERHESTVNCEPNLSERIAVQFAKNITLLEFENVYIYAILKDEENALLSTNELYLKDYKELAIPRANLSWGLERIGEDNFRLKISTDCFACMVKIDLPDSFDLSDNYFNIHGNEMREVMIRGQYDLLNTLKVDCINDAKY